MKNIFTIMMVILILYLAACSRQITEPGVQVPTQKAVVATPAATAVPAIGVKPVVATAVKPVAGGGAQIANPASKNCIDKGGKLEIRTDANGGQYGVCIFPNGKECEEWAFMRGQCSPEGGATGKSSPTYSNAAFGFGLTYAAPWKLQEKAAAGTQPLTVTLTREGNSLTIQVKHASDGTVLGALAPQGGEISQQGTLKVLGQEPAVQVVTLEGKLKSAGLNVNSGDLQLRVQLDNNTDAEIPAAVLAEAEQIVSSLQIVK